MAFAYKKPGSIRDAQAIFNGQFWNPSGRKAYDGSALDAVQNINRATSSLRGEEKVLFLCSTLVTGDNTSGQNFCKQLEKLRDVWCSAHTLPVFVKPFQQELPTTDKPNPTLLSHAQVEANNAARFDHEMAIETYWNNCYAHLLTSIVKAYMPTSSFAVI